MKYRAKADGFVDMHYVCEGEVFEYDGPVPSWATPLEEPKSAKPETEEAVATPPPAPKKKTTKK
jgi:hypothetical protein